jgi:hypothetical protein
MKNKSFIDELNGHIENAYCECNKNFDKIKNRTIKKHGEQYWNSFIAWVGSMNNKLAE